MEQVNKTYSYVKLKPETMAKLKAISTVRSEKDQMERTFPNMVTQLVNEAFDNEVGNK